MRLIDRPRRKNVDRSPLAATLDALESRQLLANSAFTLTITELAATLPDGTVQPAKTVTILDDAVEDSSISLPPGTVPVSLPSTILYNPSVQPFADFNITGLTVISNKALNSTISNVVQNGSIVRTSTAGNRTLVITATDIGFTTPNAPTTLNSAANATFTNYTSSDQVTFRSSAISTTSMVTSDLLTLRPAATTPGGSTTSSSSAESAPKTFTGPAPFTLTNTFTITLGASTGGSAPSAVNFQENGTTTVLGSNYSGKISGTKYLDASGNGLNNDGTPRAGSSVLKNITINLYNNPGLTGTPLTTVTDTNGNYSFDKLAPGTYYVAEQVPTGFVQTGPTTIQSNPAAGIGGVTMKNGSGVYTVTVSNGTPVSGVNFADYMTGACGCNITCLSYTITGTAGTRTVTSLPGNTDPGDVVTANFTLTGTADSTLTLVTYTATANFDLTKQAVYTVDTETLHPGRNSLTVTIPNSYYQIDFVCGQAITQFGVAGSNISYHGEGRFLDADRGGCELAPSAFASLSGLVFNDLDGDGVLDKGESGLGGVVVKLTGKTVNGVSVAFNRITAANGTYSFQGLQPGSYKVTEVQPYGFQTTKNRVGTVGGTAIGTLSGTDTIDAVALAVGANGINYNFGEAKPGIQCGQTGDSCFWRSCDGNALIRSFNGGPSSRSLSNWLTCNIGSLFGKNAGSFDFSGDCNSDIVSQFNRLFDCYGSNNSRLNLLSVALSAYATSTSLGGNNTARADGFIVNAVGLGGTVLNVGSHGDLFNTCDNSSMTVIQLLSAVDDQVCWGLTYGWYGGSKTAELNCLVGALLKAGSIC